MQAVLVYVFTVLMTLGLIIAAPGSTLIYATTSQDESSSDDEQENEQEAIESQDDPEPAQTDEPETPSTETPSSSSSTEPEPPAAAAPPLQEEPQAQPVLCPDGITEVENIDDCPTPPVTTEQPLPQLPLCDGSAQDCVTQNGDVCLVGQGGHECECAQDMSDCPNHPSLQEPPVETPTCPPGQFPVTPGDPSSCVDCEGPCPETPPPPTEEEGPDEDCLFNPSLPKCASDDGVCPDGFFQNEDANCVPDHPNGCPTGYHSHEDDETGQCIPNSTPCQPGYILNTENKPTCEKKEFYCQTHHDSDKCKFDSHEEREHKKTIIIKKIIHDTDSNNNDGSGHHHESFPEIDIIGISAKENGDAQICLMNIDDDNIQCQDFGMPDDRVSGDLWRIIETDHDKDYDDGDTGSDDIDDVIDDIKSQDFSALDDASNHDFDIDLAWIAISPDGEGVVCLTEDSSGKGKALCEPFKVSSQEISGQITEGVQFT